MNFHPKKNLVIVYKLFLLFTIFFAYLYFKNNLTLQINKASYLFFSIPIKFVSSFFTYNEAFLGVQRNYVEKLDYNLIDLTSDVLLLKNNLNYLRVNTTSLPLVNSIGFIGDRSNDICFSNISDIDTLSGYPLLGRYEFSETKNYKDISSGLYADKIYLKNVLFSINNNIFTLKSENVLLFDQTNVQFLKRTRLENNSIELVKSKIDKLNDDFLLELNKILLRIEKNNDIIAKKIILTINSSNLPVDLKNQIEFIFSIKENLLILDTFLYDLIEIIKSQNNNGNYSKILNFLIDFESKLLRLDKDLIINFDGLENTGYSAYDLLYENKKIYLDTVLIHKEFIVPSDLHLIVSKYETYNYNDDIMVYINHFKMFRFLKIAENDNYIKLYLFVSSVLKKNRIVDYTKGYIDFFVLFFLILFLLFMKIYVIKDRYFNMIVMFLLYIIFAFIVLCVFSILVDVVFSLFIMFFLFKFIETYKK